MNEKLDPAVVGETIRSLRVAANMSQEALAKLVGGAGSKVSDWEKGKRLPETVAVYAMARHFGVTVDYILAGQERVPGFVAARLRALLEEIEERGRGGDGGYAIANEGGRFGLPQAPPDTPIVFDADKTRKRRA